MPLPTLPTTKEIRDRIISDIEEKISQNTPLFFKAFNRVLAAALAFVFTILYKFGQWAYKQIFTITQDIESLILKGEQYNIPRKNSVSAVVTVALTGSDGVFVPQGTEFRSDISVLLYTTNTAVSIDAGTASVDITCLTPGEIGNLLDGATLTIQSPILGLNNRAIVSGTVIDGEEVEPIEEYRARISEREKRPPQGGALVDYIYWAKEVAGVTRAFAFGKREVPAITAGYVYVFPLTDGEDDRIPTAAKLVEVHDYIDDPTRAPMQVPVIVVPAMVEREFSIDISALEPNTAEIRNLFTTNIEEFLLEREPQQFIDQIVLKNTVSRSYVESIGIDSGATSITLELFIDGTVPAIESHELAFNELAKIGTLTFP